jgi:hypothetical protein
MGDWFIGIGYEGQLATWLVASFVLYFLASQVAWHSGWVFRNGQSPYATPSRRFKSDHSDQRGDRDDILEPLNDHGRDHPLLPWMEEVFRLAYYLGIPCMAAISGWLGADLIGIRGPNWMDGKGAQGFLWEDWIKGSGLATAAVLAVIGVWFVGHLLARRATLVTVPWGIPDQLWQRLLNVCYYQVHWAFYRSGPILWLDDLYWGTFVGLTLVLLESALNPALWWALKSPETAGPPLIRLGLAWINALLFLATQNIWLTAGAHLVLIVLLGESANDSVLAADNPAP